VALVLARANVALPLWGLVGSALLVATIVVASGLADALGAVIALARVVALVHAPRDLVLAAPLAVPLGALSTGPILATGVLAFAALLAHLDGRHRAEDAHAFLAHGVPVVESFRVVIHALLLAGSHFGCARGLAFCVWILLIHFGKLAGIVRGTIVRGWCLLLLVLVGGRVLEAVALVLARANVALPLWGLVGSALLVATIVVASGLADALGAVIALARVVALVHAPRDLVLAAPLAVPLGALSTGPILATGVLAFAALLAHLDGRHRAEDAHAFLAHGVPLFESVWVVIHTLLLAGSKFGIAGGIAFRVWPRWFGNLACPIVRALGGGTRGRCHQCDRRGDRQPAHHRLHRCRLSASLGRP